MNRTLFILTYVQSSIYERTSEIVFIINIHINIVQYGVWFDVSVRLFKKDQTLEVFCENRFAVFLTCRSLPFEWIAPNNAQRSHKTNDSRDSNASRVLSFLQLVFEVLLIMFCASDKLVIKRARDFVTLNLLYDSFESFGLVFRAPCGSLPQCCCRQERLHELWEVFSVITGCVNESKWTKKPQTAANGRTRVHF